MIRLSAILPAVLLTRDITAKDVYADNEKGNDSASGTKTAPVRTIRRGMELIASGDTLLLTPNAQYIHFSAKNRHPAGKNKEKERRLFPGAAVPEDQTALRIKSSIRSSMSRYNLCGSLPGIQMQ